MFIEPTAIVEVHQAVDEAEVARLDSAFQAATKRNDAEAIDVILHANYALVLGDGRVVSREMLLREARDRVNTYEIQDETPGSRTVRVWGDTAVVTAELRIKGTGPTGSFDRTLWFSDTYVGTPSGWKYAFAQASLPLPDR